MIPADAVAFVSILAKVNSIPDFQTARRRVAGYRIIVLPTEVKNNGRLLSGVLVACVSRYL
jgi:hypothetical protein